MREMSNLEEIDLFVEIIKRGGIAKAALHKNLPKSTVSRKLSQLEQNLGMTLIQRSTRKMRLTPEGEVFYHDCLLGLQQLEEAQQKLLASHSEPQGLLRITTPLELNRYFINALVKLARTYPLLKLEIESTNRFVNLIEEGFDIACRAGNLEDSSYKAKKLGDSKFVLIATPQYLSKHPPITHPLDLLGHPCIIFKRKDITLWKFSNSTEEIEITPPKSFVFNSIQMCAHFTRNSMGISFLPEGIIAPLIEKNIFVKLLPQWTEDDNSFYLVYPTQKALSPKIKETIDFLYKELKDQWV